MVIFMSQPFLTSMKDTLLEEHNLSRTENGAFGYRTTGKELLDLNFAVSSLRREMPQEIQNRFWKAYYEAPVLAVKWLFFARDIRGGMGERRLFRVLLSVLANEKPEVARPLLPLVPEYGRWDDLWSLLGTPLHQDVLNLVSTQWKEDLSHLTTGDSVSLLAKWLPSPNASAKETKYRAKQIYTALGLSERDYRKNLSTLRGKLDVVEKRMSRKDWGGIRYEEVPSQANLLYNGAFFRHDGERRRAFLEELAQGKTKIHAGTLFPHDIVARYIRGRSILSPLNPTLEQLWKALPDTVQGTGGTLVMADGSGSMMLPVSNGARALEVANALAIYFGERCAGPFHNTYLTFSERPQLVDLDPGKTLRDKLQIALSHAEVANTNVEAAFQLILDTAVKHHLSQEELPQTLLILSDMEFDRCVRGKEESPVTRRLFDVLQERYEKAGYHLSRLVFWNISGRTLTIPMKENQLGVTLVSGFSPNVVQMIFDGELDPYACLRKTLDSSRYAPVEQVLADLYGEK